MTRAARAPLALARMADFTSVLSAWRDLGLEKLQDELARHAPAVTSGQKDALLSRKALADRTREFKRQSPCLLYTSPSPRDS